MKLIGKQMGPEVIIIYQHGDEPALGFDKVISKPTMVECLEELLAWYKQRYE